jgi:replicative DNA helicase
MATATAPANLPPQNLEAEASVLGAMMVSASSIDPVLVEVRLTEADFYLKKHGEIFAAIKGLSDDNAGVDALSVADALAQRASLEEVGGKDYVQSLVATVPAAGNARHYAKIVKEHALLRRLRTAGQKIQQSVDAREADAVHLAEQAESMLFSVAHDETRSDFRSIDDILHVETERLERLAQGDGKLTGTPSGFRDLDELTGGFQPENLIVLAARPAMGKSSLVTNIAEHVAVKEDQPVAFFSLEMSETELAHRFIASQARISGDLLRKGKVRSEWNKVLEACNRLASAPLYIDDSADLGLTELRAKARRLYSQKGGLGLVIVDYLQLMRAEDPHANRVEQVGQISRGLKILAKELGVPVIGVSQLSRAPEARPDKRPILSDLRESGQIEQDADVVAFIYRGEVYGDDDAEPDTAELIIAKHRNGPIKTIDLAFLKNYPMFKNLARRSQRDAEGTAGGSVPGDATATSSDGPSIFEEGGEAGEAR